MEKIFREVKTRLHLSRDSDVNFAPHIHDDVELVYVVRGSGTAFCDGKRYSLSDGSFFLVFPDQIHGYCDFPEGEYILLTVNPSRLLYVEELFRSTVPINPSCTATPSLVGLLLDALEAFSSSKDSYVVDGYLTVFFGKLFQTVPLQRSPVPNDTAAQILQYCSSHYRDVLCVQDLCNDLHISRSYVSHIFSQRLKISFPEYMNALRLNKAILLLQDAVLNMTQVAERAGFPTIRTFNRVFRKQFGCSPSEYRQRLVSPKLKPTV